MAEDDDYIEQFIDKCCGEVDRETRKAANTCMARNAERDSTKPKWARVPQGKDTCPTCLMLASRGFAYNSKDAAEHSHPNCDCVVVCSWDKKNPALEGYDPDEYYDRWKHPEIYKGLDPVTTRSLACLRVAEKRGQVVYEKPLLSFLKKEEDRRDLVAHAALARAGKRFTALAEDAPEGYSNIDLLMDGKKWEVKSPHKSNPRAVETRLRAAKDQFEKNYPEPIEEVRVVFNGYFYGQSDEFVASKIAQEGDRHGITEVIHVDKSGKLAETWKARTTFPDRPGLQTGNSIAHAASSTEEHRSPKPTTEVRPLGGVPGERVSVDALEVRLTAHVRSQMKDRGISVDEIDDADKNPLHRKPVKVDDLGRPSYQKIGKDVTIVINPDTDEIVSTWRTHSRLRRRFERDGDGGS